MVTVINRGGINLPPTSQGEYAIDTSSNYAVDSNGETALGAD